MSSFDGLRRFDRFHAAVHANMVLDLSALLGRRVLDVGCGAGGATLLLAQALDALGFVCALDINPELLRETRACVKAAAPASHTGFCAGDIENLPFGGGAFDFVWCSRVVHHHLPDPSRALVELRRALKPAGTLALREIGRRRLSFSAPGAGLDASFVDRLQDGLDLRFERKFKSRPLDDSSWRQLLEDAGFKDVEIRVYPLIVPAPSHQAAFLMHWLEGVLEDHQGEWGPLLSEEDAQRLQDLMQSKDGVHRRLLEEASRGGLSLRYESVVYVGRAG